MHQLDNWRGAGLWYVCTGINVLGVGSNGCVGEGTPLSIDLGHLITMGKYQLDKDIGKDRT